MSISTDGQLCFGVVLEEEVELPWGEDFEEWWRGESGFQPTFNPYDAKGNHVPGVRPGDPRIKTYQDEVSAWDEAHSAPVELVNACSGDYPRWVLAVPGTARTANRGYPLAVDLEELVVDTERLTAFRRFVTEYGLSEDEPGWWLSSYWG